MSEYQSERCNFECKGTRSWDINKDMGRILQGLEAAKL